MPSDNEVKAMDVRKSDTVDGFSFDRRIPVWGIIAFCATILSSAIVASYSFYASYNSMASSVDKLTIAVEKQKDNNMALVIKTGQHDMMINANTQQLLDLKRDMAEVQKNQRWAPK